MITRTRRWGTTVAVTCAAVSFLISSSVSAKTYLDRAREFSTTISGLFSSYGERAELLGPDTETDQVWKTFSDREGFSFLATWEDEYSKDGHTNAYFAFGSDLRFSKPHNLSIDVAGLEIEYYGFTYSPWKGLTFEGIEDVIEASAIFEDTAISGRLVKEFFLGQFLEGETILLQPTYGYTDDDGEEHEVEAEALLAAMGGALSLIADGLEVIETANGWFANGDKGVEVENVEYGSVFLENLLFSEDSQGSFYYTNGTAGNLCGDYRIQVAERKVPPSKGLISSYFDTYNSFRTIYDIIMYHDVEVRIQSDNSMERYRLFYSSYDEMRIRGEFSAKARPFVEFASLSQLGYGLDLLYCLDYEINKDKGSLFLLDYGREYVNKKASLILDGGLLCKLGGLSQKNHIITSYDEYYVDIDYMFLVSMLGREYEASLESQKQKHRHEQVKHRLKMYPLLYGNLSLSPASFFKSEHGRAFEDMDIEIAGTVAGENLLITSPFIRVSTDALFEIGRQKMIEAEASYTEHFASYVPYRQQPQYKISLSFLHGSNSTAQRLQELRRELRVIRDRWGFGNGLEEHEIIKFQNKDREDYFRAGVSFGEDRGKEFSPFFEVKRKNIVGNLTGRIVLEDGGIRGYGLELTLATAKTLLSASSSYAYAEEGDMDRYDLSLGLERLITTGEGNFGWGIFAGVHTKVSGTDQVGMVRFSYRL